MDLFARHDLVASVPVISLEGPIDLATIPTLHQHLNRAIADHRGATVMVDLDGVTMLDDCGLGILLGAAGRARDQHGDLVVVTTSERLRRRFASTRLDRAIDIRERLHPGPETAIYHAALPDDWDAARASGRYTTSTRGVTLDDEGFIHCSYRHQVQGVVDRFYADAPELVLLRIDPDLLAADVVAEPPADGIDELFPHVYGPVDVAAVVSAATWRPVDGRYRLADVD